MNQSDPVRAGSPGDIPHPEAPLVQVPHSTGVRDLARERTALALAMCDQPGHQRRAALAELVYARVAEHYMDVVGAGQGLTLAAVGSVGRADAGPHSDLDLVLLHDGSRAGKERAAQAAHALWYPMWDAGLPLDHSTRSLVECRQVASTDLAAAAGLLDVRHVAGDEGLAQRARSAILTDWRAAARTRLPDLLAASRARAERFGELAYLIEPNLKESRGGLRDYVSLAALAATWLTDRPHGAVDEAAGFLLDVRDAMHLVAGKASPTLGRHLAGDVAAWLGMDQVDDLFARIAQAGRTVAFAVDATERGARRSLERSGVGSRAFMARRRHAAPRHVPVATGLIDVDGELALAPHYDASADPVLPLRTAAAAATTGCTIGPSLLESLGRCPDLPVPWPREALEYFMAMLSAPAHLVAVWEAMDVAGQVVRWIPQWAPVRNRPQRNPFHIYTVDRHQVETVVNAARMLRQAPHPHLVLVAALFHDIGKQAGIADHAAGGAALIPGIGAHLGLDPALTADLEVVVREHLTLAEFATTRDPHDPAVAADLLNRLGGRADLFVTLRLLTEADARAASPTVWTPWRAQLVNVLAATVGAALPAGPPVG